MRSWLIFIMVLWGASEGLQAQSEPALLQPSEAFVATIKQGTTLGIHFHIVPGYYLYQHRIKATVNKEPLLLHFPPAEQKEDPHFGNVPVYYHEVTLPIHKKSGFVKGDVLEVTWQGCAQQGVCYIPQVSRFVMGEENRFYSYATDHSILPTPKEGLDTSSYQPYFAKGLGLTLLFFYLAGVGMAFTACMYPLIPIISTLITGNNTSYSHGFLLSFIYVQAMALMYVGAGITAALSGKFFAITLQQPWVLISLACFFLLMACAVLGLFQLQIPTRLQSWLLQKTQHLPQGNFISAAILGIVSSLIIGPCMAPPLAAALAYIGKEGNIVLGALALYVLALGIGTPLLMIGMVGQRILPRLSFQVMKGIKGVFGFVLLATALWVAMPVLPIFWVMSFLGLLLLVAGGVLLGQVKQLTQYYIARISLLTVAGFLLIGGAVQLIGAMTGGQDIRRPLATLRGSASMQTLDFIPITSVNALKAQLALHRGKFILLDFYADWCISCQEMERFTLHDPQVQSALKGWVLLKADVTHSTAENQSRLLPCG